MLTILIITACLLRWLVLRVSSLSVSFSGGSSNGIWLGGGGGSSNTFLLKERIDIVENPNHEGFHFSLHK